VTNMSWGTTCPTGAPDFMERYVDWAVRNLAATLTISSGNQHPACPANFLVSSPGTAWGVITVGAQFDGDNGFWTGDGMGAFSRFLNPVGVGRGQEKPEVVAVGVDVRTTDAAGGDWLTPAPGVDGTSFSSPNVAGIVTQMLSRRPGQRIWPEANKAAIMTSAYHDIVAGIGTDGVGSVVATAADDTYRNTRFRNHATPTGGPLLPADFVSSCAPVAGAVCRRMDNAFTVAVGQRVRVAIAWDAWAVPAGATQLGADIDLYVIRPDNVTVQASSITIVNAYEMVDFVAPVAGAYDIVVQRFSSVAGWPGTFLGAAWSFATTTGTTPTLPNFCTGNATPVAPGAGIGAFLRSVSTVNGPTWFDGYAAWGFPQAAREAIIPLVLTMVRDVTITDTAANMDIHVITIPSCAADPIVPGIVAQGVGGPLPGLFINNLAPGTYYIVVDGRTDAVTGLPLTGAIGSDSVTVTISGP
ncbi:MAG: S8 family serine peptidase, partial [Acidobacteriota bacterium]